MVNNIPGSELRISAVTGGITLIGATLKAHRIMTFTCLANLCPFTAGQSDLIAATSFTPPLGAGGTLSLEIKGPINVLPTSMAATPSRWIRASPASP
jgi:hypothetical protein